MSHSLLGALLIVKDEERCIRRCLNSLIDVVDEIVVVDTGSIDKTREIIKEFHHVKLVKYKWEDDFAKARNFGLKQIKSKWIFTIDADEFIENTNMQFRDCIIKHIDQSVIFNIKMINLNDKNLVVKTYPRIFPKELFYYKGKVHEQLVPKVEALKFKYLDINIVVNHDGYLPEIRLIKNKSNRNISLLKKEILEQPEDVPIHYFLGREYHVIGDYHNSIIHFKYVLENGIKNTTFSNNRKLESCCYLVRSYLGKEDTKKALEVCEFGLQLFPNNPELLYFISKINYLQTFTLYMRSLENLEAMGKNIENSQSEIIDLPKAYNSLRVVLDKQLTAMVAQSKNLL